MLGLLIWAIGGTGDALIFAVRIWAIKPCTFKKFWRLMWAIAGVAFKVCFNLLIWAIGGTGDAPIFAVRIWAIKPRTFKKFEFNTQCKLWRLNWAIG